MIRLPPRSTRTDTLFPYTTLFRSLLITLTAICLPARSPKFFMSDSAMTMVRSEEHTSELQSLMRISYAVFCLKKKTNALTHKHHFANIRHIYRLSNQDAITQQQDSNNTITHV